MAEDGPTKVIVIRLLFKSGKTARYVTNPKGLFHYNLEPALGEGDPVISMDISMADVVNEQDGTAHGH